MKRLIGCIAILKRNCQGGRDVAQILKGKPVVEALKERISEETVLMKEKAIEPTLGIIRVGNRADDVFYEKSIIRNCESVGIKTRVFEVKSDIDIEKFCSLVKGVNEDNSIHGIMLFRPLPEQLDIDIIKHLIDPHKDVDCINPENLRRVFEGDSEGFPPCTPEAVVEILKHYDIPLEGANAVIINSSMVVGKPLAMMLLKEESTITVCHIKTRDLPKIASKADIVVSAVGRAKLFGEEYFGEDTLVIDVGINDDGNGKICGDIDFEKVNDKVKGITPVPGGVGTVTTAILLRHVLEACKKQVA